MIYCYKLKSVKSHAQKLQDKSILTNVTNFKMKGVVHVVPCEEIAIAYMYCFLAESER